MSQVLLKRCPMTLAPQTVSSMTRPLKFSHQVSLGPQCPPLELTSGHMARLADGSAEVKLGNTSVLSTVCRGRQTAPGFLPLTVDYRQKAAAAGRLPANLLRRELGASEREILTSRMIDRSVRPLASHGWGEEVGVTCNLLAVDSLHDPDILAINATSLALALSSLPWTSAVGAVRVGHIGGRVVVNPSRRDLARSLVNVVISGTAGGQCTMLEGDARNVSHKIFLQCIEVGLEHCATIARNIDGLALTYGKTKATITPTDTSEIVEKVKMLTKGRLRGVFTDSSLDKLARDKQIFSIRDETVTNLISKNDQLGSHNISDAFNTVSKDIVRDLIFDEDHRVDGRTLGQVRPISCDVNMYNPLHGSAVFQRGQTQVLCTVTLDSLHSALKLDPMSVITGGLKEKNFLLHYEFPSYATGDVRSTGGGGANRRETGHGALAERALRQVVPEDNQWTVRLTSEVLESNGSSSMASVCGGTLALLDAGIHLTDRLSGVAMGLMTRGGDTRVLTDIIGMEDYMGDMDFKFAGSRSGVCAVQADVKIAGISLDIIKESVERGMEANHHILDIMEKCIKTPRTSKSSWPVSKLIQVPAHKRGKLVGPGGLNIKRITGDTGVQLHPEEDGGWTMFAPSQEAMSEAEAMIEALLAEEKAMELEFGAVYTGKIVEMLDRGVMLSLGPGLEPMLCHNSQLDARRISHPSALGLELGQEIQVKYYGRDPVSGQVRLSRKVLTTSTAAAVAAASSMKRNDQTSQDKRKKDKDKDDDNEGTSGGTDASAPGVSNKIEQTTSSSSSFSELLSNPTISAACDLSNTSNVEGAKIDIFNVQENLPKYRALNPAIEESLEEKYYHIDTLINKVMKLKNELLQTSLKRQEAVDSLEKVKDRLNFLNRPNSGNLLLVEAFHKDTLDKYRNLLAKIKAIDESILHLQRQYDDTKSQADAEKLNFINLRNSKSEVAVKDDVVEIEDDTPINVANYKTFNPSNLLSRDKWSDYTPTINTQEREAETVEDVMSDWVKLFDEPIPEDILELCTKEKCLICNIEFSKPEYAKTHYLGKRHIMNVQRLLDTRKSSVAAENEKEEELVDWTKLFNQKIPQDIIDQCNVNRCNICKVNFSGLKDANSHYSGKKHRKNVQILLNKRQDKFLVIPNGSPTGRSDMLDNKEARMRDIAEMYFNDDDFLASRPWVTENVIKFVENSITDFLTLLKWLEDLQSQETWKNKDINEITYGLGKIHTNLEKNLLEIEKSYKFLENEKQRIKFIGDYVRKPNQFMLKAANMSIAKLEEVRNRSIHYLTKNVNISKRIDQNIKDVWKTFHIERKKLGEIKEKLLEVEVHEERVSELDDWREDPDHHTSAALAVICGNIDEQHAKIMKFTKQDINNKWKFVDKELKRLQLLRVQALVGWLSEMPTSSRPHWLCDDLYNFMKDNAKEYWSLEDAAVLQGGWISRERNPDYDLMLDMAYSRLRTSVNRVKYGRIENMRHKRELELYQEWMVDNKDRLRDNTVSLLETLIRSAGDKIGDVDSRLMEYVSWLSSGDKDQARQCADLLETIREGKRNTMKELVQTMMQTWNKEGGRQMDFVAFKY